MAAAEISEGASGGPPPVFIEEEIGKKWDRCFADGVLKLGGGLVLGTVFSLLFFKGKRWPIWVGSGFGIGMAYSNCERDLNKSLKDCSQDPSKVC